MRWLAALRNALPPRSARPSLVASWLAALSWLHPAPSAATELTLLHTWSSDSEVAALRVFIEAFEAKGHRIQELSVPHEQAGASPLVSLILAGKPPNLFAASPTVLYREIRDQGLGQVVGPHFRKIGAWSKFPPIVQEVITVDGEVRKVPSGIHLDGVIYYNTQVAAAAGVDPASWKSLEAMFADQVKVEAAGYTFLAVGGNSFQAGYLFHALLAAVGGRPLFYEFWQGRPKPAVFTAPGLRRAIEVFRQVTSQADSGSTNRSWSESTNTVISGQALMHLHGDWMKGQWKAHGKRLGADYNCINVPGAKALSVTVDTLGILGGETVSPQVLDAELQMAGVIVDPVFNSRFAALKGSTPVRTDASSDGLDACNQLVLRSLKRAEFAVQNPYYIADSDWISSVWNTLYTFQGNPNMSTDDVLRRLRSEHRAIFR